MDKLSDYLKKFKRILGSDEETREKIVKIVAEKAGIVIACDKVILKGENIFFNITPIEKNIIFINKSKILEELQVKGINIANLL